MKYRVTKKEMKEDYGNKIYCVGNGDIQHLLSFVDPVAYSTRAEGWACDWYEINGICLCSGYAPIGKMVDYEIRRKYDEQAREIRNNWNLTWEEQKQEIDKLLIEFIEEITGKKGEVKLTKKQKDLINDNLNAYIANFGYIHIEKEAYGKGFYVFTSEKLKEAGNWAQYCYNIDYLNGWLYGAVQAANGIIKSRSSEA